MHHARHHSTTCCWAVETRVATWKILDAYVGVCELLDSEGAVCKSMECALQLQDSEMLATVCFT